MPILPAATASAPLRRRDSASSEVTLLFPFVPVTPSRRPSQKEAAKPVSPKHGRPDSWQSTLQRWPDAKPGLKTKASKSPSSRSPKLLRLSAHCGSSSKSSPEIPACRHKRIAARPLLPAPKTATRRGRASPACPAGFISTEFQGGQARHGEKQRKNPETDDHLVLVPAL